jgi:hypothetical protein
MIAVAIKPVVKRDTFGFSGNSNYNPPSLGCSVFSRRVCIIKPFFRIRPNSIPNPMCAPIGHCSENPKDIPIIEVRAYAILVGGSRTQVLPSIDLTKTQIVKVLKSNELLSRVQDNNGLSAANQNSWNALEFQRNIAQIKCMGYVARASSSLT